MDVPVYVLDASIGAKWYRKEAGSHEAASLLHRHATGELVLAVDALFFYEVLHASTRGVSEEGVLRRWNDLDRIELAVVPLSAEL
ncbi:MAG TPA: hypothetical protein VF902_01525, partial [Coriobacteriia bacterium]